MFTVAYQIMCMVIKTSRDGACGRLPPSPQGDQLWLFSIDTIHSPIGSFNYSDCLLFIVCFSLWLKLPLLHLWQLYSLQLPQLWLLQWLPPPWSEHQLLVRRNVPATTTHCGGHSKKCCQPCHCAAAATSVPDAFFGLCKLCHGSSSGEFSFSEFSIPPISICWCLL